MQSRGGDGRPHDSPPPPGGVRPAAIELGPAGIHCIRANGSWIHRGWWLEARDRDLGGCGVVDHGLNGCGVVRLAHQLGGCDTTTSVARPACGVGL